MSLHYDLVISWPIKEGLGHAHCKNIFEKSYVAKIVIKLPLGSPLPTF